MLVFPSVGFSLNFSFQCVREAQLHIFCSSAIRLIPKMSFHTNLPPCDEQCDIRWALDRVDGWIQDDKYPSEALGLSAEQPGFPQFHISSWETNARWKCFYSSPLIYDGRSKVVVEAKNTEKQMRCYFFFSLQRNIFFSPAKLDKSYRQMLRSIALMKEPIVEVSPGGTSKQQQLHWYSCLDSLKRKVNISDFYQGLESEFFCSDWKGEHWTSIFDLVWTHYCLPCF